MNRRWMTHAVAIAVTLAFVANAVVAGTGEIFPFPVHERELDNGLKVVVVTYDSPGTVAFLAVVRTGSRDEIEPGHSGFAHFFEHMMFRGTDKYPQDDYNDVLKRMGADSNAFTSDDRTVYHMVGPAAELETMMDVEADRFQNLKYSEDDFRREALAVLGEYNKNISNPFLPMFERMRKLAFTRHTYGHTTMGFIEDIKAMPGYYDYSLGFFDRFYRPENVTVLVVGDADPDETFALSERYWGGWERGYEAPAVLPEPPQTEPKSDHIDWTGPISPHLMIGYRAPAFSDTNVETATLDIISQLLFAQSAPLYQKLVVEEQWVDFVGGSYSDHRDPYLFTIFSRAKSDEALAETRQAISAALADLRENPVDAKRLERIKSNLRYSFALSLDKPESVALTITNALILTGDPQTVNRVYEQYDKVTAEDVLRVAADVFVPEKETAITLSYDEPAAETAEGR